MSVQVLDVLIAQGAKSAARFRATMTRVTNYALKSVTLVESNVVGYAITLTAHDFVLKYAIEIFAPKTVQTFCHVDTSVLDIVVNHVHFGALFAILNRSMDFGTLKRIKWFNYLIAGIALKATC